MQRKPVKQGEDTWECGVACLAFCRGYSQPRWARRFFAGLPQYPGDRGYSPLNMQRALLAAGLRYKREKLLGRCPSMIPDQSILLFDRWAKWEGKFFSHYVVWAAGRWMDPLTGWRTDLPITATAAMLLRPD